MIRAEYELNKRTCQACGERRATMLVALSPNGSDDMTTMFRLCVDKCLPKTLEVASRLRYGDPGDAETLLP